MKYRYACIIFALAFILQTTVFGMLPVFGVSANHIKVLKMEVSK